MVTVLPLSVSNFFNDVPCSKAAVWSACFHLQHGNLERKAIMLTGLALEALDLIDNLFQVFKCHIMKTITLFYLLFILLNFRF